MDLRVLKYFVTVVHEECITAAAEKLNVTQPTLSRQLKELEEELGTQLFNRGSRSRRITLTPKGAILRRRAEELLALAGKTVQEVSSEGSVEGTIYLGITESAAEALLCKAAAQVRERYPDIGFELTSGLSCDLAAALDKGVLDFACFPADTELSEYETVSLPGGDLWGVAVPYVDLGDRRNRLGGSALCQVYRQLGSVPADLDVPARLKGLFDAVQFLNEHGKILAYHDISDGGLFVTLCEMSFAGHCGLTAAIDQLGQDNLAVLFNEEPGAVMQVRSDDAETVLNILSGHGLANCSFDLGSVNDCDRIIITRDGSDVINEKRSRFRCAWAETTWHMQALRDNPGCAKEEFDAKSDDADPGLSASLSFDIREDVAAPYISKGARPKIAILREEGVNSASEMAAAFDRAGFACADVHMSDILSGAVSLSSFKGFAACGGFSYGDVLGAGEGWAKSILFSSRGADEFSKFFGRKDTFALGVCNGCQMMSALKDLIPGAENWPRFVTNLSERFEARFVEVEIQKSPSVLFAGMEGSRLPIVVSHGEGRAEFADGKQLKALDDASLVCVRYVDHYGKIASAYPLNPNGSPEGITSVTTPDGRFTILMPHPERVMRTVCNSWHPDEWGEDSPWVRVFRNARVFVG